MTDDLHAGLEALLRRVADHHREIARLHTIAADLIARVCDPGQTWRDNHATRFRDAEDARRRPLPVPDVHVAVGSEAVEEALRDNPPPLPPRTPILQALIDMPIDRKDHRRIGGRDVCRTGPTTWFDMDTEREGDAGWMIGVIVSAAIDGGAREEVRLVPCPRCNGSTVATDVDGTRRSCPDCEGFGKVEASAPPDSHPFAAPIPPSSPAVYDSFPWDAPAVGSPLDRAKNAAQALGRPLSAAKGLSALVDGEPQHVTPPIEAPSFFEARAALVKQLRTPKPAAPWEPSDTSWARINAERMPLPDRALTLSAYLAACPARRVKPGDRDFVRWVREQRQTGKGVST